MKFEGHNIAGRPGRGRVASSSKGNAFNLYMTEDVLTSQFLPFELVDNIAGHCGIRDPTHISLLYTALSDPSLERIDMTFAQQGIHIIEPIKHIGKHMNGLPIFLLLVLAASNLMNRSGVL